MYEGAGEIHNGGLPLEHDREDEEQADRGPRYYWSVGLEVAFLEIASNAVASFPFVYLSIRGTLAAKCPRARKNLARCLTHWDFDPTIDIFKRLDFFASGLDPAFTLLGFASHSLIETEQIGVGVDRFVRRRELQVCSDGRFDL